MAVKARLGAGMWDYVVCQDCATAWSAPDANLEWSDDPEDGSDLSCPSCHSVWVVREERG